MRVFVSYRRSDSLALSKRLGAQLAARFGQERVFLDHDVLLPGGDYHDAIDRAVATCDALVAVIGEGWLDAREGEKRRLEDPADYVRYEIAAGLSRGVLVIPVLLDDAAMPQSRDLPADLRELAQRQAYKLSSGKRFGADVRALIDLLDSLPVAMPIDVPNRLVDAPSPTAVPPGHVPDAGSSTETIILGSGEFHELRALRHDGTITSMKTPLYYGNIDNATLRIIGNRVSLIVERLKMYTHPGLSAQSVQADGRLVAIGSLDNGYAYLTYTAENVVSNQTWCGVCVLRIPKSGKIHGFWMTEGHTEQGKVVMGELSILKYAQTRDVPAGNEKAD